MNPIYWNKYKGSFWFSIFGYGLSIENREIYKPSFSERNGYVKVFRIGKYAIRGLKP